MPDLGVKLSVLADRMLDEMLAPGAEVSLDQRIDALKAIGTLHLGLRRLSDKKGEDDAISGPTMADMRRRINGAAA